MDDKQIQCVVVEVLKRMLPHLGASGKRGDVIVVFTGATAGFTEAIQQVRSLVLHGFRVQLVFSRGAEVLYAPVIWEQLEGFPHVAPLDEHNWLHVLKDAQAVVVPLLSVNTLSKLSFLIADNLASNLVLHALFMGKPLIVAQNGVDPTDKGRVQLHFDKCGPALASAIWERLELVRGYGCHVVDVSQISAAVEGGMERKPVSGRSNGKTSGAAKPANSGHNGKIITAADVLYAQQLGVSIRLKHSTRVTPLARDLAVKLHVGMAES